MQHLEEGTIHAWLDGALSADEQASVEQHVRQCAECAAMVAEARGMIAGAARIVSALDVVPGGVIPKKATPPRAAVPASLWRSLHLTPFRAGLAASLMIAAASLFAVRRDTPKETSAASSVAVPAVVDRPLAAAPQPAPPPEAGRRASSEGATRPASPSAGLISRDEPKPAAPVAASSDVAVARADATQSTDSTKSKAAQPAPPSATVADAKALARDSQPDLARDRLNAFRTSAISGAAGAAMESRRVSASLPEVAAKTFTSQRETFVGCYQVVRDSLYSPSVLPDRFALDQLAESGAVRHVVRAVGTDGRVDTALTSAAWSPVGATMVNVSLSAGAQRQVVVISQTGNQLTADVPGRAQPVRLTRSPCKG